MSRDRRASRRGSAGNIARVDGRPTGRPGHGAASRPAAAPGSRQYHGVTPDRRTRCRSRSTGSSRTPTSPGRSSTRGRSTLAASLKARGQLQPIRVRWDDEPSGGSSSPASGAGGPRSLAGLATLACVEAKGRHDRRRDPGGPARRELPPRGPQADRAGPGVPGPDRPPGLLVSPARRDP